MKLQIYIITAFTAFAFLILTTLANAQPVMVNDADFETPVVTTIPLLGGLQDYNYTASPDYLTGSSGWYVSSGTTGEGSVTLVNQGILGLTLSPISGDSSNQYLVLNGLALNVTTLTPGALGGISQTIATTPGQTYQVSYQTGALSLGVVTGLQQLSAGVNGVTVTSSSGGALIDVSVGSFQNQTFTFTANSGTSVLDFYEPSALLANVGGVAIDNVAVTAVPEPRDTMAILLVMGLGILMIRRFLSRRKMQFDNRTTVQRALVIDRSDFSMSE